MGNSCKILKSLNSLEMGQNRWDIPHKPQRTSGCVLCVPWSTSVLWNFSVFLSSSSRRVATAESLKLGWSDMWGSHRDSVGYRFEVKMCLLKTWTMLQSPPQNHRLPCFWGFWWFLCGGSAASLGLPGCTQRCWMQMFRVETSLGALQEYIYVCVYICTYYSHILSSRGFSIISPMFLCLCILG